MATDNKLGIKIETMFDFSKSEKDLVKRLQQISQRGLVINTRTSTNNLRGLNSSLVRTNSNMTLLGQSVTSVYRKFTTWYVIADIVKTVFGSIRDGIKDVEFLNSKLLEIDYSMDLTNEQMLALTENSDKVAHSLNTVSDNVLRASAIFSNAGESLESLNQKSQSTILLSNLSGSSVDKMADAVNAASYAFGIQGDELDHVSDVMVKVATETGIDFQKSLTGISDSLAIGGNVAATYGMSLEQWVATVGKIAESTRASFSQSSRGMVTVMTRLNSVLDAQSEEISNLDKKFQAMGISIKDSSGQLLPVMDIFKNISDVYPRLTKNQRAQVAQLAGATRNQRFFNAVMMEYNDILDLTDKAINSQGEAMRLNEKRSESLIGAQDRLTQARKELFRALISPEDIKGFLNASTSLLNGLTNLAKQTDLVDVALVALGMKLSVNVIPTFVAFTEILGIAIAEEGILNGTTLALNTTFLTLGSTLTKIATASGFGILFYAIGQVIKGLMDASHRAKDFKSAMSNLSNAQEEFNKKVSEASTPEELERVSNELESMKSKWDELQEQAKHPIGKEQLGEAKVGIDNLRTEMLKYGVDAENVEEDLAKKTKEVNEKKLKMEQDMYAEKIKYAKENVEAFGKIYGYDLNNYKTHAEAKLDIDKKLLSNLGKMWNKYFNMTKIASFKAGDVSYKNLTGFVKEGFDLFGGHKKAVDELNQIVAGTSMLGLDLDGTTIGGGTKKSSASKALKDAYDSQNKALEYQLTLIRSQRQELSNTSKEYQDSLHAENLIYQQQLDLNDKFIAKGMDRQQLQLDSLSIIKQMNDNSEDWWMTLNRGVDQTLKQIDYELQVNSQRMSDIAEGSQQWYDVQEDNLMILKNQRFITEEYINQLRDQVDLNKLNGKELEDAQEKVKSLNLSYMKIDSTIKNIEESMIKQNEETLKAREDVEDKLVDIIKSRIEEQGEEEDKHHEKVMNRLEKEHQEKIKNLDEEQAKFEEYINDQIKAIDKRQEKESFEEELAKKQEERAKTQKRISALALVGSGDRATVQERKQLEEQLKKQNEEIDKFINDRSVKMTKESLKEKLEDYKDNIKDKKSELDQELKDDQEREDRRYAKHKERLDRQLENENIYNEARRMMEQSTTQELISLIWDYERENGKAMSSAGDSIYSNLIRNLQIAKREVFDLKNAVSQLEGMKSMKKVDYDDTNIGAGGSEWSEKQIEANQRANEARSFLSSQGYSQGASDISSYGYEGAKDWYDEYISDRTDLSSNVKSAFKDIVDAKRDWSNAAQFKSGGTTPSNIPNSGALAVLHKNEKILNEDHTRDYDMLMNMVSSVRASQFDSSMMTGRGAKEVTIGNLINVEGNVDKNAVPQIRQVADQTLNKLTKILQGNNPNINGMLSI